MPFQDREIPLQDFLGQVRARLEQVGTSVALTMFNVTLETDLVRQLQKDQVLPEAWNGIVNAGDFDTIYPFAAGMLRSTASSLYSEVHPDSYQLADAVSQAFCGELNAVFQATEEEAWEPIRVQSYAEMMADAGLVRIENDRVILLPPGEAPGASAGKETEPR